jgi:hypothetical protein
MHKIVNNMEKIPFGKFGFIHKSTSDWMRENLNSIIAIGAGLLVLGSLVVYQWNSGSLSDYITAEKTFNEWSGDRNEKLIKLQKILKQHPELHAQYDGRIAQKLLINSEQGLAASFSKATQKRIGGLSPYYTRFSNCSLLIGEKKFESALSESKALKLALDQDEAFWETKSELVRHGGILYGYNLLRIAFLEQYLGNADGELAAWKEFKKEAGWLESESPTKLDAQSFELISQNFQRNDVSLKDFIQYRETFLQN